MQYDIMWAYVLGTCTLLIPTHQYYCNDWSMKCPVCTITNSDPAPINIASQLSILWPWQHSWRTYIAIHSHRTVFPTSRQQWLKGFPKPGGNRRRQSSCWRRHEQWRDKDGRPRLAARRTCRERGNGGEQQWLCIVHPGMVLEYDVLQPETKSELNREPALAVDVCGAALSP